MKKLLQTIKQESETENVPAEVQVSDHQNQEIHSIPVNRNFRFTGLVVVGIGFFVYNIFDWIVLIFTGTVIAIALESNITYFEQKTHRRRLAILISYLILVGLLLSGILIMIPFLINQIGDLIAVVITQISNFENSIKTVGLGNMIEQNGLYGYLNSFGIDLTEPRYLNQLQSVIQNNISAIISFSSNYAKGAGSIVVSTVGGVLSTLTQIGFVLTLSVLLSIEKGPFTRFLYRLTMGIPSAHKKIATLYSKLGFWLKTQILLGIYIGVTMRIGLLVLGIFGVDLPNKGSLAVISALTELIPYIGPLLGGIPVVIMGAVSNGRFGVILAGVLVFCMQRIENNVLIPLLFKRNLGVSPVLTFLCMVLLGITMGINGVILAIPVSVIITIMYEKS